MSPCCSLAVPLPRFQYQKQQTQQQQQKQQQQQHQQQHHQQQQLQQQQQTQQQKRPKHPKPQKAIKTTAANHEKTCEESNRCRKTFKKQKGSAIKTTLPKNKKSYKNRVKIEPGGPKMEPGCTKSGAKIEKNALNRPKWLPDGSQDPFTGNDS